MDSEVQQIKDKLNIVEVVGQYVQLRRAGRNYSGKCPFHNERTPSFMVSPERGTYICFGCGEKGDVFSFVQKMDGLDFPTVLKQLAEKAGVTLTPRVRNPQTIEQKEQEKEKEERLREVCEAAVKFYESELQKRADVLSYLKTRGVSEESIQTWRLGYAPATWESLSKHLVSLGFGHPDIVDAGFAVRSEKKPGEIFDRFRGRIMFPIFDAAGQPIAVSGRFFERVAGQKADGSEPAKYVNSPETALFKKSKVLYGFDKARVAIRKADCILLVEGQFDLVLAHQSGLPFTTALSGTALTAEHLSLLGRLSKRLVLALDADAAGLRSGLKSALMAMAAGFDVKVPTFPDGKDPADVARENPELLKAAVRTSKTAVEFFIDALRPGTKDVRAYQKLVETHVLPLVAAIESSIEREHFIRLIAGRLNVSELAVRAEVAKKPTLPSESSLDVHQAGAESGSDPLGSLSSLEKKAAMLLFHFGKDSDVAAKLVDLLGASRVEQMRQQLEGQAEALRFRFDAEVGEHSDEETIAADMLANIDKEVGRERFKMKFL
ncbi:MAG TPA: DNA primase [Candidatus Paceibacterota bacterium]|jgi:DNA primase|nr:DNA primase [Candidatus Paceibacterota bacterium]